MSSSPESDTKGRTMALVAAFLGWMFDGLEMGLFPLAGRPALKELLRSSGSGTDADIGPWFAGIIAAFLIGAAVGGVLFGWLGDRVGRVKAMVWSVATYSVFSGLCGFVNAPWQLGALRFIASLGMGGEWALGVSLVSEIWPAKSRPLLSGLIGAAANVGFFLVGVVKILLIRYGTHLTETFHAPIWRLLFIAGAVPALLTFVIRIFVPESEKWKAATSKGPKPRVADIFAPGIAKFTWLGASLAGVALLGTWASVQWIPAWTSTLPGVGPTSDAWAQMFAATGAVVLPLIVALLAERYTRRITYVSICIASIIACEVLFLTKPPFGFVFLLMVTMANGITGAFYGWLPLYLPELFPTRIRATGSGFCFNIGRVIAAAGALFGGQLHKAFNGDYARMCSVICLVYFAGLVVIYYCPETKGKPLPE